VKALTELDALPDEAVVFIDSNIFTYFLLGGSKHFEACKVFLKRVEKGKIAGIINDIVITETWFNYVKYRIVTDNKISVKEFVQFVKKNPGAISKVDVSEIGDIFSMPNIHLIAPPQTFVLASIGGSERPPLLSNDAYHLIAMRYAGVENIATNDPDFDLIKGIAVWRP